MDNTVKHNLLKYLTSTGS